MSLDPTKPFNELPDLPPPTDLETKSVLKRCVSARAAIAELRLAGQLLPDQSVLINAIPLLEAKASSAIENIVTTNDAMFREASHADDDADLAVKEASRYRSALINAQHSLQERPITTRTATEICTQIKNVAMDVRRTPGTTLQNKHTGETIYTPPEGDRLLRNKLKNWESFVNSESDIEPLVKMAVQHYQFEAIHPFTDGNGRTGRILNLLYLIQAGLLDTPTLYLSRYILQTRAEYYNRLANVTFKGEWEPWIAYMLDAVETTASWTNHRIRAIRALMENASKHVKTHARKIYSRELIDAVFAQPYVRITHLDQRQIAKPETASRYLKQLAAIGVLEEEKVGRNKFFVHRKYMRLLESDGHDFEPYPQPEQDVPPKKPRKRRKQTATE